MGFQGIDVRFGCTVFVEWRLGGGDLSCEGDTFDPRGDLIDICGCLLRL